ncbi:MAG: SDR family oxidoreductase [Rhodobacteraceae bacterium]|nr:MAG: SDR family oxidoreductase [Paracoccaceae bacterium]
MFDLTGARVVVTGAAGSVGGALCRSFAAAGARIVGCDRTAEGIPEVCAETHGFDLADAAAVAEAGAAILAAGAPDILVSNAGWTRAEVLEDVTPETFGPEMDGNFTGAARLSMALLPAMRQGRGNRSVVFVLSVNAQAHFGNPVYAAAKAAGLAWVRALATEEGRHGIRANAVVPASIRTGAWDHRIAADPGILDRLTPLYPLGRLVTPQEVANAVLFLASPLASGITGAALNVDAGLMAGNLPFIDAITNLEQP